MRAHCKSKIIRTIDILVEQHIIPNGTEGFKLKIQLNVPRAIMIHFNLIERLTNTPELVGHQLGMKWEHGHVEVTP